MAKKFELKERGTNETVYPITLTDCTYHNGERLDNVIDSKAEISLLSNTLAEEVVDETTFEDFGKVTREDLKKDLFIDMWNNACIYQAGIYKTAHGKYNEETGFFELNGITDIGWEEAIRIYNIPRVRHQPGIDDYYLIYNVRTCFPIMGQNLDIGNKICRCCAFEVIRLLDYYNHPHSIGNLDSFSKDYATHLSNTKDFCSSYTLPNDTLKKVLGKLNISTDSETVHFNSASYRVLEQIYLYGIRKDFVNAFSQNTVLKIDCWKYMIEYALNTKPIAITVHSDIMAKLLGEGDYSDGNGTKEEWTKLLEDATAKQIQFATA